MKVSRADVEHVARLAALAVDEGTLPALTDQIGRILEYVSQLEAVDDGVDGAGQEYPGPRPPLRDDLVRAAPLAIPLKELAPDFREGLFLVPRLGGVGPGEGS